jgi:hypothetical protein
MKPKSTDSSAPKTNISKSAENTLFQNINKIEDDFESELAMIQTIDSSSQSFTMLYRDVETISATNLRHELKFKEKRFEPCEIEFVSSDEENLNKKEKLKSTNSQTIFNKIDVKNHATNAIMKPKIEKSFNEREIIEVKSRQITQWDSDSDSEDNDDNKSLNNYTNWD